MPKPQLNSVAPNCGPVSGGTSVTLLGANLEATTEVRFGDIALDSSKFVVHSDTKITAESPPHPAGTAAISVRAPGGASDPVSIGQFKYPCSEVIPEEPPKQIVVPKPETAVQTAPPAPPSGPVTSAAAAGGGPPAPGPPPLSPVEVPALLGGQNPVAASVSQQAPFLQPSSLKVISPVYAPGATPAVASAPLGVAEPARQYSMVAWQGATAGAGLLLLLVICLWAPSRPSPAIAIASGQISKRSSDSGANCRIAC